MKINSTVYGKCLTGPKIENITSNIDLGNMSRGGEQEDCVVK
jgi:hypothetical protein